MHRNEERTAETVRTADRLAAWLTKIGAESTGAAVDFADTVAAAWVIEDGVQYLLTLDPTHPDDARQALDKLGEMYAWLFNELRYHVDQLERAWPVIEGSLAAVAPDEPESSDAEEDAT